MSPIDLTEYEIHSTCKEANVSLYFSVTFRRNMRTDDSNSIS